MNLVLRFSALGDIVLCSAFIKSLQGPTVFVTQNIFKNFIEEYFEGDRLKVYGLIKPKWGLLGWFWAGCSFGKFMKLYASPRIDELNIYDLHNVSKSVLFSWGLLWELEKSKIVSKITLQRTHKERLRRWMLLIFKKDIGGTPDLVFMRHLKLLNEHNSNHVPQLKINNRGQKYFPRGPTPLRLLLAPDAQHWKKIWPIDYWKSLLRELSQKSEISIEVTLVSQRTLIESTFIDSLKTHASPSFRIRDLQNRTSLIELPYIASENDLLICGNTAWLHIAEATGTPVLALAGPIVTQFGFSPFLKESYELEHPIFCRPCTLHGDGICPWTGNKHHACMKELTPPIVLQRLWKQLGFGAAPL